MSRTTSGVRKIASRPKFRLRPYGSSAASNPNGASNQGPYGTAARITAPRTAR